MANKVKSIGLVFALIFGLSISYAQQEGIGVIGPFGTLNNTDSSIIIPSNKAQDLLNVNIAPGGQSVEKRKGFEVYKELTDSSSEAHGVYSFFSTTDTIVDLYFNGTNIESSIDGGSLNSLSTTEAADGATYDCTDSRGYAYCMRTEISTYMFRTDGMSLGSLAVTTGTMITSTPLRLVVSGDENWPNMVKFSKENDFETWLVGGDPEDPITFTIDAPGTKITHITYAFGGVMWFKESSFGFIFDGPTLGDWETAIVSPNVGTTNNTSVFDNGILYFIGQDSHIYAFDGSNVARLSREITATIDQAQTKRENEWTQSTQSDFGAGTANDLVYVDTITTVGELRPTYPDVFSNYRDGTSGTKDVWDEYLSGTVTGDIVSDGTALNITHDGNTLGFISAYTSQPSADFARGTTFHFEITEFQFDSGWDTEFFITFTTWAVTGGGNPHVEPKRWYFDFYSTETAKVYWQGYRRWNTAYVTVGEVYDISASPLKIDIYFSTNSCQISINDTVEEVAVNTMPDNNLYTYMSWLDADASGGTVKIGKFGIAPIDLVYTSQLKTAISPTAWDAFEATYLNDDASHTFYIRASTGSFSYASSTPAWTTISPGAVPTISTGSTLQVRDRILTTSWDQEPKLYDFTVNWFEGLAEDKAYSIYHDDAIWFSVTCGEGASVNNKILRYDLPNKGWTIYDFGANGMFVRNEDLYFGSTTDGEVYKFGYSDSDNGVAIEAYWKSKDFNPVNPFIEKEFRTLSVAAKSEADCTLSIDYTINGSSTTSYSFDAYDSAAGYMKDNRLLPVGKFGDTINVKFGNDAINQYFEVYGIQYGYVSKPWRPSQ